MQFRTWVTIKYAWGLITEECTGTHVSSPTIMLKGFMVGCKLQSQSAAFAIVLTTLSHYHHSIWLL